MSTDGQLRLRELRPDDEAEFRAGHEAMRAEGHIFGLALDGAASWQDYLRRLDDYQHGRSLAPDRVPSTFLVAEVGGEIVGRTSIRHRLNDFLLREGGHIGYGVLRQHRRCGYATEILQQSLRYTSQLGIDRVLVTCEDSNIGSSTVIERCGGQLESVVVRIPPAGPVRRYWIAAAPAAAPDAVLDAGAS